MFPAARAAHEAAPPPHYRANHATRHPANQVLPIQPVMSCPPTALARRLAPHVATPLVAMHTTTPLPTWGVTEYSSRTKNPPRRTGARVETFQLNRHVEILAATQRRRCSQTASSQPPTRHPPAICPPAHLPTGPRIHLVTCQAMPLGTHAISEPWAQHPALYLAPQPGAGPAMVASLCQLAQPRSYCVGFVVEKSSPHTASTKLQPPKSVIAWTQLLPLAVWQSAIWRHHHACYPTTHGGEHRAVVALLALEGPTMPRQRQRQKEKVSTLPAAHPPQVLLESPMATRQCGAVPSMYHPAMCLQPVAAQPQAEHLAAVPVETAAGPEVEGQGVVAGHLTNVSCATMPHTLHS